MPVELVMLIVIEPSLLWVTDVVECGGGVIVNVSVPVLVGEDMVSVSLSNETDVDDVGDKNLLPLVVLVKVEGCLVPSLSIKSPEVLVLPLVAVVDVDDGKNNPVNVVVEGVFVTKGVGN